MDFKSDLEALILAVLREGPAHGYEIAKRIRQRSSAVLEVGENRLYPSLHQLEEQGMVAATWEPQENRPARKTYNLTEAGVAVFDRKLSAWESFAGAVNAVLATKGVRHGEVR